MSNKVAIASCIETLEDYLKTDVCAGHSIYCQFSSSIVIDWKQYLNKKIIANRINAVVFSDGVTINNDKILEVELS